MYQLENVILQSPSQLRVSAHVPVRHERVYSRDLGVLRSHRWPRLYPLVTFLPGM